MIEIRLLLALAVLTGCGDLHAETYRECRGRVVARYRAGDLGAMETVVRECLALYPGHPGMGFNLALAQALADKPEEALATLQSLAERGLAFETEQEPFAAVRELPGYADLVKTRQALEKPVGEVEIALQLDDGHFIPEGLAWHEASKAWFLGSIRESRILKAGNRRASIAGADGAPLYSVFALRLSDDGRQLWAATAAVPQGLPAEGELGRSGLIVFDVASGKRLREYWLPVDGREHVLGDFIFTKHGVITTDSLTGEVLRLDPATGEFAVLIGGEAMVSPQGLVEDRDGKGLFVADYTTGLHYYDWKSAHLRLVDNPAGIPTTGTDGLYRAGNALIAIQNGVRPQRVVRWRLDSGGRKLADVTWLAANLPEFDEPTLGTWRKGRFCFTANSHWNRFDADNNLPDASELSGAIILCLDPEAGG